MRLRLVLCVLLLSLAPETHADEALRALRLDATNVAALSPGGADATGGVGDWALTNGRLCAVVSDPSHESDLAVAGGALVDLGHCGRGDDQLVLVQPLANLDRGGAVANERVEAGVVDGVARVATFGGVAGCDVETVYALDLREPERLRIVSTITRRADGPRLFGFGDIALHSQHALRPFGVDLRGRVPAIGFAHPAVDLADPLSIVRATSPTDVRILAGAQAIEPGISYALRWTRAEQRGDGGAATPVAVVSLSAENFTGFAAFAAPFWLGAEALGPLQIAQTLWMDLDVGETLVFEREVLVSQRNDVASLTDRLFQETHRVSGHMPDSDDPDVRVVIESADGRIATEAAVVDSIFSAALPRGAYRFRVLSSAGGERSGEFTIEDEDVDLGDVAPPPYGKVALPRGSAMRLTFIGVDGTPDPRFGEDRPIVSFGTETPPSSIRTRDVSLAGAERDPTEVVLAPGRYRVLAGRGPEFDVREATIEVRAGETTSLAIEAPARVLDTPGWIAADLHVHAAPSDDSALPIRTRIASFVAEGGEVLVATDHDHVTDYAPSIRELGLASQIASVVGQEMTSSVATEAAPTTFGHANAFPLPYRPTEYRKGAIPNEGRRLREAIDAVRALGGERIVQLNHARSGGDDQGFFEHLSIGHAFEPEARLSLPPNAVLLARDPATGTRDLDFDVMELLNGHSMERYRALRADWFALLRHGEFRTGTANSDSHLLDEPVATPRNLVRVSGDRPERFHERELVEALRAGRVVGTTGPILDVRLGDAGPGDTFRGREATLRIEVRAAPWVPVGVARVFVNGVLAHETAIAAGGVLELPQRFDADAFVTVEVEGTAEPGSAYALRLPKFTPLAFANPIFVDSDEDGAWKTPEG